MEAKTRTEGRRASRTRRARPRRRGIGAVLVTGAVAALVSAVPIAAHAATTWNTGDVFAAVANGKYRVYANNGTFKEQIDQGVGNGGLAQNSTGFTTGCSFNPDGSFLHTTNFSTGYDVVFDNASPHPVVQNIATGVNRPGDSNPESITFRQNGEFFIGHAQGLRDVHHYNAGGGFIGTFDVQTEVVGSDWIDLARDQNTLFYTSEGRRIFRYDVSTGTQLPDFAVLPGFNNAFALRLLPPGDGTGGLLVADRSDIKRLDGAGNVVQTYDTATENAWFALNLDPNGTSFWSGSFDTNNFYRFSIATGAVEVGPIASGGQLFGLCLKGERTAGGGGGGGGGGERPPLDHFRCYRSSNADNAAFGRRVTLEDQFGEFRATVDKLYYLCNPTDKDNEGVRQPDGHEVMYKLVDREGAFKKRTVEVRNQFGTAELVLKKPNRMLVPSAKTMAGMQPGAIPDELDHFVCYKLHRSSAFVRRTVNLVDQFGSEDVRVIRARMLCNPADKNGEGIQSPDEHLVCYVVRGKKPGSRDVVVRNQFGVSTLNANKQRELCVPSTKRVISTG